MLILRKLTLGIIVLAILPACAPALPENEASNGASSVKLSERGEVAGKWLKLEKRMYQLVDSAVKMILPRLLESQSEMNLTSTCIRDSLILFRGMRNLRPWALRFVDSSAKTIDGLLSGTLTSFGVFDECLDTVVKRQTSKYEDEVLFHGKYCLLEARPPLSSGKDIDGAVNELRSLSGRKSVIGEIAKYADMVYVFPIQLGMCVPSGCSLHDVNQLGNLLGNYIDFRISAAHCDIKTKNEYSAVVIFVICAYSSTVVLALIGSIIDLYSHNERHDSQSILMKILLCFSLFANFKKFRNTNVLHDTLSCLNGVRFISMTWIILSHSYLVAGLQTNSFLVIKDSVLPDFAYQVILNGTVAVDTFFCIAGLLLCYLVVKKFNEDGKRLNVKLYILHRLWRILPVYTFAIGIGFLLSLMGSGPLWRDVMKLWIDNCYDNWWMNFLFINNLYNEKKSCAMHSWFVACDMQLYTAALIVLIPLLRWPKVGLSIAANGIIASMAFSGVWTYLKNLPPTMLVATDPNNVLNMLADYYFKPFPHAGPYCVGLIAGYLLATRPKLHLSKTFLVVGWCMAITINMSVLYGTWEWNRGYDPPVWETVFYSGFHRTAWAVGIAWVVICCTTGNAGIVNRFLSWKIFIPLARLTYVAYLLHPFIQFTFVANTRAQAYPQHHIIVWTFFGHLCVTYGISFFGKMLIEEPFSQLGKLMILPKRGQNNPPGSFKQNGNLSNGLQTNKFGDIMSVLPTDHSIANGSETKTLEHKL